MNGVMVLNKKNNIQVITENALCTACGACSGICPTKAILMLTNTAGYLTANIDFTKCTYCGMCHEVCPGVVNNTPYLNQSDMFHGVYLDGYIGHAVDAVIRQKSQSGGIVTALLCYLLEKELIDGAIVNNFNKQTKRPEVVYETTKEGIIKGSGSYYSQSSVVKTILENKDKKAAAVVLGCQSESLNLIREKYPKIELPAYTIGLICAGQYSGNYIDDLIGESGCDKSEVTDFRFRDKNAGGWPGHIKIYTTEKDYILDKKVRHMLKPVYELHRCLLCFDQMNIFSDITVGDPWGITNKTNKEGNTVIIARTQKGKELFEGAVRAGAIAVEALSVTKIMEGQTIDSRLKTHFFTVMNISKAKGYMVPYNEKCFEHISYEKPSSKKFREISRRLDYSRKIYCEKDIKKIKRYVIIRKKELKRQRDLVKLINFPKKYVSYGLRKMRLKVNK